LLELDVAPTLVLDHVESSFLLFVSEHPKDWSSERHEHEEMLEDLVEKLLAKQARDAPVELLGRAARLPAGSALERIYLRVLTGLHTLVDERAAWLASEPSRLRHDDHSANLLRTLGDKLSLRQVAELELAIDRVVFTAIGADGDARWRARAEKSNRAYRVFLRERLPQGLRAARRVAFDEAEPYQLPRHVPRREPRISYVRSPMSKDQLLLAKPDNVLRALERKEEFSRWDEDDGPVGGGREVLAELARAGEDEPDKVAAVVRELLARDRKEEARQLLDVLAKKWNDTAAVEAFISAAFAPDGSPLDDDIECAWALRSLALRDGLSAQAATQLLRRLATAGAMTEPDREPGEERHRHAIFRNWPGGYTVPRGAYDWLVALMNHYGRRGEADHRTWAGAVRDALRADHTLATWSVLLDHLQAWVWLAGEHSLALLQDIERAVPDPRMAHPLARAYVRARGQLGDDAICAFVGRLVQQGALVPAAELTVLAATDRRCDWATEWLAAWMRASHASVFAAGIGAGVGELLHDVTRRSTLARLATAWVPLLDAADLGLVLSRTYDDDAWIADADGLTVLRSLSPRVREMERDALGALVGVLERFVEADAVGVLDVVEEALDRALALNDGGIQPIISECLALSFSLRIALPHERARVLAVFERALAADSVAANDALGVADGRSSPVASFLTMPLRYRRARLPRRPRR